MATKNSSHVDLTDADFAARVLEADRPVLVDFHADWCGPCQALSPVVEEVAAEYDGRALVGKVDVDSNPATARAYGVTSIPTLLFVKGGEVVHREVGALPKRKIAERLDELLGA